MLTIVYILLLLIAIPSIPNTYYRIMDEKANVVDLLGLIYIWIAVFLMLWYFLTN